VELVCIFYIEEKETQNKISLIEVWLRKK